MSDTLWRIYYGDGSTHSGGTLEDAQWAPALDVQVIWIENPKRSQKGGIVCKRDTYLYRGDRWWGCDERGYQDYMSYYKGPKAAIFGRTMDKEEDYNDLVQRALKEKLGV